MIVSSGEALVDLMPEAVAGGGPMNVAIAAARLGAPSAFVGGISTDSYGDSLCSHLTANGVDTSLCQRYDAPTARAIVEHVPELRFRFEGDGTADTLLTDVDLTSLPAEPHILHGGTLGLFRGQTAETLARLVESHKGLVSFDPNIRPQIIDDRPRWEHFHQRWLANTDIYKASNEDLAWIWPHRSEQSSARDLLSRGITAVIITRGSAGLSVITAAGEVQVGSPAVSVVDTVGAGDTIVATVLASLIEMNVADGSVELSALPLANWKTIAKRAVSAAAITCSRPGADSPYRGELDW
jgi:fructokinase